MTFSRSILVVAVVALIFTPRLYVELGGWAIDFLVSMYQIV